MIAILSVLSGPCAGATFRVAEGRVVTLGRSTQTDLQIDDPDVSRRHCTILNEGGRLVVTDLGSSNGTFVDEHSVSRGRVGHGGELRLGEVRLAVRFEPEIRRATLVRGVESLMAVPAAFGTRQALTTVLPDPTGLLQDPDNLRALLRLATSLGTQTLPSEMVSAAAEAVQVGCQCPHTALVLVPSNGGSWQYSASTAGGGGQHTMRIDAGVVEQVMHSSGCVSVAPDGGEEGRRGPAFCAPLPGSGHIQGAIWAESDREAAPATPRQLAFLEAVGILVGMALLRAHMQAHLEDALVGTMRSLVTALETRDLYTRGHSERVTACALAIGVRMGLDPAALEVLEIAGLMHDVGKLGMPEHVLHKESGLSEVERVELRDHPVAGARIVGNIRHPSVDAITSIIRHHHEHVDGTGYPDGLAGEGIPLSARIVAVADAWDAMTSDRPYRAAMGAPEARERLRQGAGTQLDPACVDAMLAWLDAGSPPAAATSKGRSRFVPTGLQPLPPCTHGNGEPPAPPR